MDFWTMLGLIGVSLFVSAGETVEPLRAWLCRFSVPYNPLKILGETLSSALCVGFFVGLAWDRSLVTAGVVSVLSSASNETLGMAYGLVLRVTAIRPAPPSPVLPRREKPLQSRPRPPDTVVLSEEEAHQSVDEHDQSRGG